MGFFKAYLLCVVVFLAGQMVFDAAEKIKAIVAESRKSETVQAAKSKIRNELNRYVTGVEAKKAKIQSPRS